MVIIPVYNTLILPDARVFFRKNDLQQLQIENLQQNDKIVFLMLKEQRQQIEQKDGETSRLIDDIYPVGVSGTVTSIDGEGTVSIETTGRLSIEDVEPETQNVIAVSRPEINDLQAEEIGRQFVQLKNNMLRFVQRYQWGMMARGYILQWKTINEIAVGLAPFFNLTNEEKYAILAADTVSERTELIEKAVGELMAISEVTEEANEAQQETNSRIYREDAIKKQIRFLQGQLEEMHPEDVSDIQMLEKKLADSGMNETARKESEKVLNRMKQEGQDGHEYGMLYDYLDFMTGLDWKKAPPEDLDLEKAEEVLDREHYGLQKVKKRIVQQLAVMALHKQQSGSILLFVGPPGTGKTSIGHSIAEALGRQYVRISLGGVRDEAEIRGHRRTYIGAMPGRIMDGMKKCGASNPVMVLDEVDKLNRDYGGDPSSALLEVLDPEQNNTFTDHYMNVPYDLSDVLFICTANSMDTIPAPLLDRMEVIQFQGYTPVEKFKIAKEHLLPKAKEKAGITAGALRITDEALKLVIENYTMESGVRGLKKQLDAICRNAAVELVKGEKKRMLITPKQLHKYLEQKPIHHEKLEDTKESGIVTGLAWTAAGGEILFIETMMTSGKGEIRITGQLGDVMKESAQIAVSLVKSMYPDKAKLFEKHDIHIHVPEGAVPKDGPSAGITLTTALCSLVTGKPVDPCTAMTGEVSLRGNVMPIGGLPEKLMAAQRAGVKRVFIPEENKEDLKDVPKETRDALTVIPVKRVADVLEKVLV